MRDLALQKLVVRIVAAVVGGTFLFAFVANQPIVMDFAWHQEKKADPSSIQNMAAKPAATEIALQDSEPDVRAKTEPSKPVAVSQLARPDMPQADTRRRSAPQQKTGTIRGRVVFKGTAPERVLLFEGPPKVDSEFCGKFEIFDESLVVNPLNNGVKNVFVYLVDKANSEVNRLQPEIASETKLVGCRLDPRCMLVQRPQEIRFHNVDSIPHYVAPDPTNFGLYGGSVQPGKTVSFPAKHAVAMPSLFICAIHPWIRGWILVTDHPFAAITNTDGTFEISGLPYGEHRFRIFHERGRLLHRGTPITVDSEFIELPDFEFEASEFNY